MIPATRAERATNGSVGEPDANGHRAHWLFALRCYAASIIAANLIWEIAQLPLYTIWHDGTARDIVVAVLHCSAGDAIIALSALTIALTLLGDRDWPNENFVRVLVLATIIGALYTVFSEWLNVVDRKSWTYSDKMIRVPWIGTGLAPLAEWLILPPLSLIFSRRRCSRRAGD
jgi:hypothetical protein